MLTLNWKFKMVLKWQIWNISRICVWRGLFHVKGSCGGNYNVKKGYDTILRQHGLPTKSILLKKIWEGDNLPKVKFFCWLKVQNKVLSAKENCKGRSKTTKRDHLSQRDKILQCSCILKARTSLDSLSNLILSCPQSKFSHLIIHIGNLKT